jgi:dimeric dUTPase (all-alpha-NTP-PPase superfamily)
LEHTRQAAVSKQAALLQQIENLQAALAQQEQLTAKAVFAAAAVATTVEKQKRLQKDGTGVFEVVRKEDTLPPQQDLVGALAAKTSVHRRQIATLDAANTNKAQTLKTKLDRLANEYQDFKFWAHKQQLLAAHQETNTGNAFQAAWQEQSQTLDQAKDQVQALLIQCAELESTVSTLQTGANSTVAELQERCHQERDGRLADQVASAAELRSVQGTMDAQVQAQLEKRLHRELSACKTIHRQQIQNSETASQQQVRGLKTKLERVADEYQDFKFWAHRQLTAAATATKAASASVVEASQEELLVGHWAVPEVSDTTDLAVSEVTDTADHATMFAQLERNFEQAVDDFQVVYEREQTARAEEQFFAVHKMQTLESQVQALQESKQQVTTEMQSKLQRELAAKDLTYRNQIRNLQTASAKDILELRAKLERMINEYQDFKFWTHRQQLIGIQAAGEMQDAFSEALASSEAALHDQAEVTKIKEQATQELSKKCTESERELSRLKKDFAKTTQQWEEAHALVQESRAREEAAATQKLEIWETRVNATEHDKANLRLAFQDDVATAEALYQERVRDLKAAKDREVKTLQTRLEEMAIAWQDYKCTTHEQHSAANQAVLKERDDLSQQISNLQSVLQEQKEATRAEGARADDLWQKHTGLEHELSQLKNDSDKAVKNLQATLTRGRLAAGLPLMTLTALSP